MKERGIIMTGWTVRAILAGTKTQTRRIAKHLPPWKGGAHKRPWRVEDVGASCPYGQRGDRLWVRETWQAWRQTSIEYDEHEALTRDVRGGVSWADWVAENGVPHVEYRATSESLGPWTPAIHMPRWASRITLEITGVRVERLHIIGEEDAKAEGVVARDTYHDGYRAAFSDAWEVIHGEGAWAKNPWVWVVSFEVVK